MKDIVKIYLETALWLAPEENDGSQIDSTYSVGDFSEEAIIQAEQDIEDFLELIKSDLCIFKIDNIIYDFYLSRNRHGAGFFSKEDYYGEILAKHFQEIAETFEETSVFIGDDGQIYMW